MKTYNTAILASLCFAVTAYTDNNTIGKRALQKSHEKPQWEKWSDAFLGKAQVDQQSHLVKLVAKITSDYLLDCTPIILYDNFTENYDNLILEKLMRNMPTPYIHGQISTQYKMKLHSWREDLQPTCLSYLVFMKDVMRCQDVIGEQSKSRVVVVARSSQWRAFEFLSHEESKSFVNLLVIVKSENVMDKFEEAPYILYTHKLYVDALGSNKPEVLTSFQDGRLTRSVNLFPRKMSHGFAGHRFVVAVAHQPPYVILKGRSDEGENIFEGIEVRLVNLLAKLYNFTTDYREATEDVTVGSSEAVSRTIEKKKANLGIGGIYITKDKIFRLGISQWHSQDCAAFISLSSTALPRYRAIMGPFHWTVWLALTIVYLMGIFPLAFSDKLTLMHLKNRPQELENMFWYVFGTFTNCFTFSGPGSWSRSKKNTTKLLIGFYWIFTIIVTACYTGSIIAFVTLPVYPAVIDNVKQLLSGRYQIGVLGKGEWPYLFANATDPDSERLLKNPDYVPTIEAGLKNATNAFFWNYAFLGSRSQLDYIVRTNFTTKSKRAVLHISAECFVPFNIALLFPRNAVYEETVNSAIKLVVQSGIFNKLKSDVEWDMMRSATGKLLAANSRLGGVKALTYEDRALTLDDTQGMFLLLGAGFLIGGAALLSEWFGGCVNICRRRRKRSNSATSIESNPRSHARKTPRENIDSNQYPVRRRHKSFVDIDQNYDVAVTRIRRSLQIDDPEINSTGITRQTGSGSTENEHGQDYSNRYPQGNISDSSSISTIGDHDKYIGQKGGGSGNNEQEKRSLDMSDVIGKIFDRVFGELNTEDNRADVEVIQEIEDVDEEAKPVK